MLIGLSRLQPSGENGWTAGSFLGALNEGLKSSLTRYAKADRVELSPNYKPVVRGRAQIQEHPSQDHEDLPIYRP